MIKIIIIMGLFSFFGCKKDLAEQAMYGNEQIAYEKLGEQINHYNYLGEMTSKTIIGTRSVHNYEVASVLQIERIEPVEFLWDEIGHRGGGESRIYNNLWLVQESLLTGNRCVGPDEKEKIDYTYNEHAKLTEKESHFNRVYDNLGRITSHEQEIYSAQYMRYKYKVAYEKDQIKVLKIWDSKDQEFHRTYVYENGKAVKAIEKNILNELNGIYFFSYDNEGALAKIRSIVKDVDDASYVLDQTEKFIYKNKQLIEYSKKGGFWKDKNRSIKETMSIDLKSDAELYHLNQKEVYHYEGERLIKKTTTNQYAVSGEQDEFVNNYNYDDKGWLIKMERLKNQQKNREINYAYN